MADTDQAKDATTQDSSGQTQERPAEGRKIPKRINVAVAPETVEALQLVIDREGVSLTEAVRRLVGYGEFIYRSVKVERQEVLLKDKDSTREIVLLT